MSSPLSPEQWRQVESIVDALLDTPPERRAALFAKVSGGDPARRQELERLVAACERTYPLLDQPAAERFSALVDAGPLRPEEVVGQRYRITRELARGGMATVYLAHDLKHARDVALKVIRSELVATVGSVRFLREIEIAAQLRHPNIVPLYDSGRIMAGEGALDDGLLYYVMPYEAGQSLRERLRRERTLSIDDTRVVLRDVCEALAHAHSKGIVHRDIKPDNILLAGRHALVSDFGVARAASEVANTNTSTGAGIMIGTPAYMAPEQVAAEAQVDHRADIYAVGVLGYELLTGRPPFTGEPRQILAAQLSQEPAPLDTARVDAPHELVELVTRCLAKDPAERWQSVSEMLTHLDPISDAAGVWQRPSIPRAAPRSIRPRLSFAGAMVALIALVAWFAWSRFGSVPRPTIPPPALAVLPFQHGATIELQPLATALTVNLIGTLGSTPGLDVRSLRAVWPHGDAKTPFDSIARSLRVSWIVSGTIDRLDHKNVVSIELIDAATGRLRGQRQVVGVPDDDLALIRDVVAQVAAELRQRIGDHVRVESWRVGTRSATAFKAVNRAFEDVREADVLMETDPRGARLRLIRADSVLAEASRADARWSEPYVQRAWIARKAALMFAGTGRADSAAKALGDGRVYAERALELQPNDPRALEIDGVLVHAQSFMTSAPDSARALMASAEQLLRRATDIDSALPRALNLLSSIHLTRGEFDQARLAGAKAYAADAYTEDGRQLLARLFSIDFEAANDADARRWCVEYRRMFARDWYVGYCSLMLMAWDSTHAPDRVEAERIAREATAAAPDVIRAPVRAQMQTMVAGVLARLGPSGGAQLLLDGVRAAVVNDSTIAREPFGSELLQLEAGVRLRLGQPDVAVELLERYFERRPTATEWLSRSRRFRGLPIERLTDVQERAR